MKRTELKRKTPLHHTSNLKRGPIRRKPPKPKAIPVEFSEDVRRQAARASGFRCAARLAGCTLEIEHFHHRRLRSAGGTGTLENCLPVCARCHRGIHDFPGWAYRHGMLVRRRYDPADIAVFRGCSPGCEELHTRQ